MAGVDFSVLSIFFAFSTTCLQNCSYVLFQDADVQQILCRETDLAPRLADAARSISLYSTAIGGMKFIIQVADEGIASAA